MNDVEARRERYRVLRPLRSDALSMTSLARDRLLLREVALSELRPELQGDAVAAQLLTARFAALSELAVAGVPEVFDRGADRAGTPWLVTEPVDAPSVAELTARPRRSGSDPLTLVPVLRALAETMRDIHAEGVVHGALGPETVLVTGARVRVIGFGPQPSALALPTDPAATAQAWARFVAELPAPSPEQSAGAAPGRRSDVYGFGCVLAAILGDEADGEGDSDRAELRRLRHLRDECLDVEAARRPASFGAILTALEALSPSARTVPDGRPDRREDSSAWPDAARETITTLHPTLSPPHPTRVLGVVLADAPAPATDRIPVRRRAAAPTPARPKQKRRGGRRRRRWSPAARLAAAGAALLLTAGAVAAHAALSPSPAHSEIVIPQLAGATVDAASRALRTAGVVVGGQRSTASDLAPGLVAATDPGAGAAVDLGGTVALLVSTGPGEVAVPQLAGLDLAGAREALTAAGLDLGGLDERDGPSREGTVLATEPAHGTRTRAGAAVDLVVASGRVRVPAGLTGQASQPVIDALAASGLQAQTYAVDTPEYVTGVVMRIEPGEGARLPVGGIVTLGVARYTPGATAPTQPTQPSVPSQPSVPAPPVPSPTSTGRAGPPRTPAPTATPPPAPAQTP